MQLQQEFAVPEWRKKTLDIKFENANRIILQNCKPILLKLHYIL